MFNRSICFGQVAYQNDPEGALIQFASPDEAKRAMQSTEAVLNNRFIRVHWFRENGGDGQGLGQLHTQQQPQPQPAMVKLLQKCHCKNLFFYLFISFYF